VIDSSATQPVVVDFWAPWCAPCRALTPVLEKLEREYAGRFKLAKVNVDENQELAEVLQVRSIPAVFAFRDGKPLGNFLGALPESQVRAFIERALPSPFIEVMDRAERLIQEGRVDAAEKLLAEVPSNIDWDTRLEALRAAVSFARSGANEDKLKAKLAANPDDHEARLKLAQLYAGARRYREAMDQLLQIAQRDKNWRDGEARRQLLTLFTLAAGEPELVSEYRRKLASALY
jgi:putative thioredoxin